MSAPQWPLSIEVQHHNDHALIIPKGYLNALTGDQIDKVCDELVGKGMHYIIINCGQIELINTIGISILVGIIEKVNSRDGLVYFTELGGTNREIFEVLGLSSVAMIFPDNASAQSHVQSDRESLRRAMGE